GFCTVALMQESLFRSSYQLAVVGPLKEMTDIFVVVIVKTRDKSGIKAGSGTGVKRAPDTCKDVPDSEWSGCYFELIDLEVADVFVINTDSSSSFPFGAYLYTTSAIRQDTICSQLGMPKILPSQLEYDFNEYISQQNTCVEETATSEPSSSSSRPTTYNTSENGSSTAADINHETIMGGFPCNFSRVRHNHWSNQF
ncbi:hypothetical protein RRG08_060126, partial [Elysia crispata]